MRHRVASALYRLAAWIDSEPFEDERRYHPVIGREPVVVLPVSQVESLQVESGSTVESELKRHVPGDWGGPYV